VLNNLCLEEETVFFQNEKVYAFVAQKPRIHCVVMWKDGEVLDLNDLSRNDFSYLMRIVYEIRGELLKIFDTAKITIAYFSADKPIQFKIFPKRNNRKGEGIVDSVFLVVLLREQLIFGE